MHNFAALYFVSVAVVSNVEISSWKCLFLKLKNLKDIGLVQTVVLWSRNVSTPCSISFSLHIPVGPVNIVYITVFEFFLNSKVGKF